jgi:hypothetical protein
VPIFFVLMGLHTDLRAFAAPSVLGLAAVLIAAAIIGKQACSLAVTTPGVDRLTVGIGMIPRGEVGLIFANVGAGLMLNGVPIISPSIFSAVVAMVVVTTLVTPPALKWRLARRKEQAGRVHERPDERRGGGGGIEAEIPGKEGSDRPRRRDQRLRGDTGARLTGTSRPVDVSSLITRDASRAVAQSAAPSARDPAHQSGEALGGWARGQAP